MSGKNINNQPSPCKFHFYAKITVTRNWTTNLQPRDRKYQPQDQAGLVHTSYAPEPSRASARPTD